MADINKIYELLGEDNFEPTQISTEERISAIEDVLLEMMRGGE